jgi:Abortive infection alpha
MIKLAPLNNVAANNIDCWNRLNIGGFWLITALPVAPFGDCEGGKMTSETDLATAVATELVKQVPIKEVYKDGLSPAVRETGSVLADFVKTIRLALAPLQFTAALQDRYVRFLDRSVRQIPEDRRILPAPQIVGPILEAIKYEPEDTLISNMYNEVLSRAFDRDRAEDAHPAYAPLIKQLSVDEAIILKIIYEKYLQNDHYKFQCTDDYDAKTNRFSNRKVELDELPLNDLRSPKNVAIYMEHLDKLGLASVLQYKNAEPIFTSGAQSGSRTFARYQLTAFGLEFMKAATR